MRQAGIDVKPSEQNWMARKESLEKELGRIDGILIDPGCIRLINGFLRGYHYPEIGTTGRFAYKPEKNRFCPCCGGASVRRSKDSWGQSKDY